MGGSLQTKRAVNVLVVSRQRRLLVQQCMEGTGKMVPEESGQELLFSGASVDPFYEVVSALNAVSRRSRPNSYFMSNQVRVKTNLVSLALPVMPLVERAPVLQGLHLARLEVPNVAMSPDGVEKCLWNGIVFPSVFTRCACTYIPVCT